MDRGTNETPGSASKGGHQKLHVGPLGGIGNTVPSSSDVVPMGSKKRFALQTGHRARVALAQFVFRRLLGLPVCRFCTKGHSTEQNHRQRNHIPHSGCLPEVRSPCSVPCFGHRHFCGLRCQHLCSARAWLVAGGGG
jgi:hypothetical protein